MRRKTSNTCIAVIERDGVVYMAGDRRMSWDFSQAQPSPIPKIAKRCGMLIGATGSGFLCSLMVDIIQYPKPTAKQKPFDYVMNTVCKIIHDTLIEKGFSNGNGMMKIPSNHAAEGLFIMKGEAFSIVIANEYDSDSADGAMGHVTGDVVSFPYATGCGGQWAWGVLEEHSLLSNKLKLTPHESLRRALRIAAKFSPGCDSQIDIISE